MSNPSEKLVWSKDPVAVIKDEKVSLAVSIRKSEGNWPRYSVTFLRIGREQRLTPYHGIMTKCDQGGTVKIESRFPLLAFGALIEKAEEWVRLDNQKLVDEEEEGVKSHREFLLEPNAFSARQVARYTLHLGTVNQGEVNPELRTTPTMVFRAQRIIANARLPKLARLWWTWLFWWLAYPVLRVQYFIVGKYEDTGENYEDGISKDEREEFDRESEQVKTRYRVMWRFPSRGWHARRVMNAQYAALAGSPLVSLRVSNLECLVGEPVHLGMFTNPTGLSLELPTCEPGRFIHAAFRGQALCTFDVVLIGVGVDLN